MARHRLTAQLGVAGLCVGCVGGAAGSVLRLGPHNPTLHLAAALVAGAGVVGLAVALVLGRGVAAAAPAAVGAVAIGYALLLLDGTGSAAAFAPLLAGGLVLAVELAILASDLRRRAREPRADRVRRALGIGVAALLAVALAEACLAAARAATLPGGAAATTIGVAAALALLATAALLAARSRGQT